MVAGRDATVPAATAAASSGRSAGSVWPANPVRGSTADARLIRRRASAMLIRSLVRRNSAAFRDPSSARSGSAAVVDWPAAAVSAVSAPHPVTQPAVPPTAPRPADPQQAEPAPTAAERAAAAASRRLRSTAPAATICRYSAARETSSTLSAKSAASRKLSSAASSTAVEPILLSSSRHRASSPAPPPSDAKFIRMLGCRGDTAQAADARGRRLEQQEAGQQKRQRAARPTATPLLLQDPPWLPWDNSAKGVRQFTPAALTVERAGCTASRGPCIQAFPHQPAPAHESPRH